MAGRLLLACPASSYRLEAYAAAARELDVELIVAIDRPAVATRLGCAHRRVDFADVEGSLATLLGQDPYDGVLAVDERSAVLAAAVGADRRLSHRPYHTPRGVEAAGDKRLMRTRLRHAGVAVPDFAILLPEMEPHGRVGFPCVVKPSMLSASQGVIRADSHDELVSAVARVRRILDRHPSELAARPEFFEVIVERYVDGDEVVVEGLVIDDDFEPIAVFDKPDPLTGPFFEETIYVTPSRKPAAQQRLAIQTAASAARALGLSHGPVHAELRMSKDGPMLIEIAARSIGGLCARALVHVVGSLERLLMRAALGLEREPRIDSAAASGVMMIPVPRSGVLAAVGGLGAASAVPNVDAVVVSVTPGEAVRALPDGDRYLGFVFAHGDDPAVVESALRRAHGELHFELKPLLTLA